MLHKFITTALVAAVCAATACQKNRISKRGALGLSDADQTAGGPQDTGNTEPDELEEGTGLSVANTVRFKKQSLIKNDMEAALGLTSEEICKELGTADCLTEVHHLALGGVDAYRRGVFVGISESMMTSPVALERIAIAGCSERARRDVKAGEGEIFKGLSLDGAGNVSDAGRGSMPLAVEALYARFLGREPTDVESASLLEMYDDIAKAVSTDRGFEWARLSCYVVATSLETVFY